MLPHPIHRFALLAMLVSVGCRPDASSAVPIDQPEDPESPPKKMPMGDHFVQAENIRDAIIAGTIDEARKPAQWLLDNITAEDVPVRWKVHVPKVRRNAKRIVEAETIADAADAAARLASACGDCHADVGIDLAAARRPLPLQDDTTFAQMDRHAYAAERMWDGLVGPIDAAWTEGATAMRDAPLHSQAAPDPVKSLAAGVHQLATDSVELRPNARPKNYGELITSCATCHSLVKGAP